MNKKFIYWIFILSFTTLFIQYFVGLHFEGYESTINYLLTSKNLPQADSKIYFTNFLGIYQLISFLSHQCDFQDGYAWFLVGSNIIGFSLLFSLISVSTDLSYQGKLLLLLLFLLFSYTYSATKIGFIYSAVFIYFIQCSNKNNYIVGWLAFVLIILLRIEIIILVLVFCLITSFLIEKKLNKNYLIVLFFSFSSLQFMNYYIKTSQPKAFYTMKLEGRLVDRNVLPLIPEAKFELANISKNKLLGIRYFIRDDCNYNYKNYQKLATFLDSETLDFSKIKFYFENNFIDLLQNLKANYWTFISTFLIVWFFFFSEFNFLKWRKYFWIISFVFMPLFCVSLLVFSFIQFQVIQSFLLIILILFLLLNPEKKSFENNRKSKSLFLVVFLLVLFLNIPKQDNVKFNSFNSLVKESCKYGQILNFALLDGAYYQPQLFKEVDVAKFVYLDYFICGYFDYFEKHQKMIFGDNAFCLYDRLKYCEYKKMVFISTNSYNQILSKYLKLNKNVDINFREITALKHKSKGTEFNVYYIQLKDKKP